MPVSSSSPPSRFPAAGIILFANHLPKSPAAGPDALPVPTSLAPSGDFENHPDRKAVLGELHLPLAFGEQFFIPVHPCHASELPAKLSTPANRFSAAPGAGRSQVAWWPASSANDSRTPDPPEPSRQATGGVISRSQESPSPRFPAGSPPVFLIFPLQNRFSA